MLLENRSIASNEDLGVFALREFSLVIGVKLIANHTSVKLVLTLLLLVLNELLQLAIKNFAGEFVLAIAQVNHLVQIDLARNLFDDFCVQAVHVDGQFDHVTQAQLDVLDALFDQACHAQEVRANQD